MVQHFEFKFVPIPKNIKNGTGSVCIRCVLATIVAVEM